MSAAVERWIPMPTAPRGTLCDFCWLPVLMAAPGPGAGKRATRAWYSTDRHVFECNACHQEWSRALLARLALERGLPVADSAAPASAGAPLQAAA